MIKDFKVEIPDQAVSDLRRRLDETRWPAGVTDSGGIPLDEVRRLATVWRDQFDFKRAEAEMNTVSHFKTTAHGHGIHFVHEQSTSAHAPPLLLLHGWPGSFVELLPLVPLLRDHFHLVIPSLPGFGFSDPPTTPGVSNQRAAHVFAELMSQLGYARFFVQGGDFGAGVATWLARKYPDRLIGMHLNYIPGSYAPHVDDDLSEEELTFLHDRDAWTAESYAYGHLHRTRPLTLAYGLSDSPVGLAAWIAEKFREWADPSSRIPVADILTNITVYWMTNTIGSSVRFYLESVRTPLTFERGERLTVPCGIARFPFEAPFPPRSWIARVYDIRHWTEMPRGGHFASLEAPDLLAADVIRFAARLAG